MCFAFLFSFTFLCFSFIWLFLIFWNSTPGLIWLFKSVNAERVIKVSIILLNLLRGAHGSCMSDTLSPIRDQSKCWTSESPNFSPPSVDRLGCSVAYSPALSCGWPQRCEGPERDLEWLRGRWGGRGRRRGRGQETERRSPGSTVWGWLVGPGRAECCEGCDPVDGSQSCRWEESRRGLPTPTQRGDAEGGRRWIASQQSQIPASAWEGRWGGGLRGGGHLRKGSPRPRRKGQDGCWRRLKVKGIQLACTVGEVGHQACCDWVCWLPVKATEVPHHLPNTLSEAQSPVVDRQGPRVEITSGKKKSFITNHQRRLL